MTLVTVDPGVKATGIAHFIDKKLHRVALVRSSGLTSMIGSLFNVEWPVYFSLNELIVERPTVYRRGSKGDPNDLISIAIVAGAAAMAFGCETWTSIEFIEPRTWKGSVKKTVHNARIIKRLDKEELEVMNTRLDGVPKGLIHNVVDAIGIGLYKLGRM